MKIPYRKKQIQKHSTKTVSIHFFDSVRKQINNGKLTGASYVNLSKGFDNIGHSVLLQKCSTYGVKNKKLEWFNSYLFSRNNYDCVDRNISRPEPQSVPYNQFRCVIVTYKHGIYELPHELLNDLRLGILGN